MPESVYERKAGMVIQPKIEVSLRLLR